MSKVSIALAIRDCCQVATAKHLSAIKHLICIMSRCRCTATVSAEPRDCRYGQTITPSTRGGGCETQRRNVWAASGRNAHSTHRIESEPGQRRPAAADPRRVSHVEAETPDRRDDSSDKKKAQACPRHLADSARCSRAIGLCI